ncbi:hypothetical protein H8744_15490 [Oscillospiraceae bacterium N12]|jgi:hypothetical protein|uniref:Alpha-L-glutamate ligase-related protein ATP-grasp domain-containing protein n=1 Tax=Jilunia laotingensis TaxID=2763675 RepID=A0A926IQR6_9BACT|nr:sugar-transfer associated ATP-grasp domain-containing protein [Jilunia laotingensis]MBC8594614.1 hypothetical protein [Jilunia laotingensis]
MKLNKVKLFFQEFRVLSYKYNFQKNIYVYFLHWMILRNMYWIDMEGYFENEVWRISEKHDSYFEHFHKYIHRWKYVYHRFNPGKHSQIYYRLDYILSKIFCPGLDAMDYFRYEFYNYSLDKKRTFITEGGIAVMDKKFNGGKNQKKYREILSNKSSFNRFFSEYINRSWISSDNLLFRDFFDFLMKNKHVIVKPIDGVGGEGIFKKIIQSEKEIKELYDYIKGKKVIIEEVISQCTELKDLNPSSVNTIRVYSVEKENRIFITGALLRIGNGKGITDNYSSGGLAAAIDVETGIIISPAVSQNNDNVYVHPYTNKVIIGLQIPKWCEVLECVKQAHSKMPQLRYIGWDVVICEDGTVTFLEANTCSGVELQQHPLRKGVKHVYAPYL